MAAMWNGCFVPSVGGGIWLARRHADISGIPVGHQFVPAQHHLFGWRVRLAQLQRNSRYGLLCVPRSYGVAFGLLLAQRRRRLSQHVLHSERNASAPASSSNEADCPQLVAVVKVLECQPHPQRPHGLIVLQVSDPDFPSERLQVVAEAGTFDVGDEALLVAAGAQVPCKAAEDFLGIDCSGQTTLQYQVKRMYVGGVPSEGVLVHKCDGTEFPAAPDTASEWVSRCGVQAQREFEKRVLLHVGFVGDEFHGSDSCHDASVKNVLLDAILALGTTDRSKASLAKKGEWQHISRTDVGVHARSFLVCTPRLRLRREGIRSGRRCAELLSSLQRLLPASVGLFDAVWVPCSADLFERVTSREYRYYFPASLVGDNQDGATDQLRRCLRLFVGTHCFANFTAIGQVGAVERRARKRKAVQKWLGKVYAHRRWRSVHDYPAGTNVAQNTKGALRILPEIKGLSKRNLISAELHCRLGAEGNREEELFCIRLVGSGFLYNMVRLVVGSSLAVVNGALEESVLIRALAGDQVVDLSEHIAPAHGLVLYEQHVGAPWLPPSDKSHCTEAFMSQQVLPAVQRAWATYDSHTLPHRGSEVYL